jgi:hypothetical protein
MTSLVCSLLADLANSFLLKEYGQSSKFSWFRDVMLDVLSLNGFNVVVVLFVVGGAILLIVFLRPSFEFNFD